MNMRMLRGGLLLALAVSLGACGDELRPEVGPQLPDYFPTEAGTERTYDVLDSVFLNTGDEQRLSRRRETVSDEVTDLQGRTLRTLRVETGPVAGGFTDTEIWRQYLDAAYAEVYEGSTRVLVLANPIRSGNTWEGNQFNNRGYGPFQYLNTDTTVTIGGRTYERCVQVLQRRSEPGAQLSDIETYEIYAPGIGKIVRYDRYYVFTIDGGNRVRLTDSYLHVEQLAPAD